jgi:hypothetical protein
MQIAQPLKRGRPKSSGRYGEPTVTVRVPVKMAEQIKAFIDLKKRRCPLYVVGKPSESLKV